MPRATATAKYPGVFADVVIAAARNAEPIRVPCASPDAAVALRYRFYSFMRAAERELFAFHAAKDKSMAESAMFDRGLTRQLIAIVSMVVEGHELVFVRRDEGPDARLMRSVLAALPPAPPAAVPEAPDPEAFLKRLNSKYE